MMMSTVRLFLRQNGHRNLTLSCLSNEKLANFNWDESLRRKYSVVCIGGGSGPPGANRTWCRLRNQTLRLDSTTKPSIFAAVISRSALIHTDTTTTSSNIEHVPIPEPPTPPVEPIDDVGGALLPGVEPSFESLGLGGWSPPGLIQHAFEYLHVTCDIPWWITIVIGTVVVRSLMFPLVILAQRNAAKMNNNLPQLQKIQLKMTEARERGDRLDVARYGHEMMAFMKEKQLNPLKNMIVPFAQAPLFISFFVGLRRMSNLPVESMKTGGLFWFTDLTVPDQYLLLPIITSATLALTIELGTDAARLNSANLGFMKYFLRAMPIIILPFTVNFSNAILVYWVSSNFISLCQVAFLRIPRVREFFKIEQLIVHKKETLPIKDKGFVKGVSDSWTNMKLSRELEERQRVDEMSFMKAGRGAVKKTYKFDPTKMTSSSTGIQAKKRD